MKQAKVKGFLCSLSKKIRRLFIRVPRRNGFSAARAIVPPILGSLRRDHLWRCGSFMYRSPKSIYQQFVAFKTGNRVVSPNVVQCRCIQPTASWRILSSCRCYLRPRIGRRHSFCCLKTLIFLRAAHQQSGHASEVGQLTS